MLPTWQPCHTTVKISLYYVLNVYVLTAPSEYDLCVRAGI